MKIIKITAILAIYLLSATLMASHRVFIIDQNSDAAPLLIQALDKNTVFFHVPEKEVRNLADSLKVNLQSCDGDCLKNFQENSIIRVIFRLNDSGNNTTLSVFMDGKSVMSKTVSTKNNKSAKLQLDNILKELESMVSDSGAPAVNLVQPEENMKAEVENNMLSFYGRKNKKPDWTRKVRDRGDYASVFFPGAQQFKNTRNPGWFLGGIGLLGIVYLTDKKYQEAREEYEDATSFGFNFDRAMYGIILDGQTFSTANLVNYSFSPNIYSSFFQAKSLRSGYVNAANNANIALGAFGLYWLYTILEGIFWGVPVAQNKAPEEPPFRFSMTPETNYYTSEQNIRYDMGVTFRF